MAKQIITTVEIIDDDLHLTLRELCHESDIPAEFIMDLVDYGVLRPQGREPRDWRFPGSDLMRVKRALRLRRDFDLNLAGLALSLELLEEVQQLRRLLAQMQDR